MSPIDEIKSRLDIVQYIGRYVTLRKAGRDYKAPCPFHSEKTPSFVVNAERQTWRCFGSCAEGGDVIRFAMKYHNWTFPEALEQLGAEVGVETRRRTDADRDRDSQFDRWRGLLKLAAELYHDQLLTGTSADAAQVRAYARSKRGLSDETLQRFQIGYAPPGYTHLHDHLIRMGAALDDMLTVGLVKRSEGGRVYDTFRNRLILPIRDERGRVIGFGARALAADDNPKYLNSPQTPLFDKSKTLYALDLAKEAIRRGGRAVIVEGYLDAIQAHQAGFTDVIAQMGTALTEAQIRLIVPRYADHVVLALDSDEAGQRATRRSLDVVKDALSADYGGRLSVDLRVLSMPGAKDPDDLIRETPEAWAGLVADARPLADFVIDLEMKSLGEGATIHEREAVARRLLPLLIASENQLYRRDNVQKLALRLRIPEVDLLAWADAQARAEAAKPRPRPRHPDAPPAADPTGAQPPSLATLDIDPASIPPPEADADDPDLTLPAAFAEAPASARAPEAIDDPLERACLRGLLLHPDTLYAINRKLREIARGDALADDPLCPLNVNDFTRPTLQWIASLFFAAGDQDDVDALTFVRAQLPDAMSDALNGILRDDLETFSATLRHGLAPDLRAVLADPRYNAPDPRPAILRAALELRRRRLRRELHEMGFEDSVFENQTYDSRLQLFILARAYLDNAINTR